MTTPEARVAFVVRGVVQQAMVDARATGAEIVGRAGSQRELVERWCDVAPNHPGARNLLVSAANKTELLLGEPDRADVYPIGDFYASELEQFGVAGELSEPVARLANAAGGVAQLDDVLRRLIDERRDVESACANAPHVRDEVIRLLEQNRFVRSRIGVVPKIGARTLGIDLFI